MSESCKVYITARPPAPDGAPDLEGEVLRLDDSGTQDALQEILKRRPDVVTLDHEFAASARGVSLIERIREDPVLAGAEIVVALADGQLYRFGSRGATAPIPDAPRRKEAGKTRRAPRVPIRPDVHIRIDGKEARLVDLSVLGAQVLTSTVVRPAERVRVVMPDGRAVAEDERGDRVGAVRTGAGRAAALQGRHRLHGPGPRGRAPLLWSPPRGVSVRRPGRTAQPARIGDGPY